MNTEDRSRTARRRAERGLLDERRDLLDALAGLPPEARAAIPADAELLGAIEQIAGMRPDSARRRIIRHHARRTPDGAWPALEAALVRLSALAPEAIVTADDESARAWADRLIDGGDDALSDLLDRYWDVDRNHLRRLLRNAMGREGAAAERARLALADEIKRIRAAHDDDDA